MKNKIVKLSALLMLVGPLAAQAVPIDQYADTVLDFSSEYTASSWSAAQALGDPDTFVYGDIVTAWAPGPRNGTLEFITLGYSTSVYANGAVIRETYGNGFVYQVDVLDLSDILHTVWTGTDTSLAGTPVDFEVNWAQTGFLVKGLKIYTNTDHDLQAWEEIDSVLLRGDSAVSVPEPGSLALLGLGLAGMGFGRRKKMPE